MRSSIFLKIAKEIKFEKQEAHVSDYYNNIQARLVQSCLGDKSHTQELSI